MWINLVKRYLGGGIFQLYYSGLPNIRWAIQNRRATLDHVFSSLRSNGKGVARARRLRLVLHALHSDIPTTVSRLATGHWASCLNSANM